MYYKVSKCVLVLSFLLPTLSIFSIKCIMDKKHQQAMEITVECKRLDKLEEAITKSDNVHGTYHIAFLSLIPL